MAKLMSKSPGRQRNQQDAAAPGDVLTLTDAAGYLKLAEDVVAGLAERKEIPGRKVGDQWRFLRAAIQDWLRQPSAPDFWQTHFGALADDPYRDEMLEEIYRRRGRTGTGPG